MKNREDILIVKDGGYFYADCLDREPKHRAETAFRTWLEEHGKDGETYILAKWLSHEMTINVKRTIVSSEPQVGVDKQADPSEEPLVDEATFATDAVSEVDPSSGQQDIQDIQEEEQRKGEPDEFPSRY